MAGQEGSFGKMLSNIRSDEEPPSPDETQHPDKPLSAKKPAVQSSATNEPVKVKRLRAPNKKTSNSVPFNQSVPVEVANTFYDIAREHNWTVSKTLTQAADALLEKLNKGK